jgi:N-acetylneuraminate synthase
LGEAEAAVRTARENGCEELVLLHCISSYPAPSEQSNLRTLPHLAESFGVVGGLSDHTHGTATSVASIALGGAVIEKHFTLARSDGGPDADFSLEPEEFRRLVEDCKNAWLSLGTVTYRTKPAEENNKVFRRSVYVTCNIAKGEVFTRDNIRSIRPGFGLPPAALHDLLGKRASRDIEFAEPMDWSMVSDEG